MVGAGHGVSWTLEPADLGRSDRIESAWMHENGKPRSLAAVQT